VEAEQRQQLSKLIQKVAGETARAYNRRKGRENAFWGDNYHATVVERGGYLWGCLMYIELNMVRCGVVKHPRDWEWVGYHEIVGERQRSRLLECGAVVPAVGGGQCGRVAGQFGGGVEPADCGGPTGAGGTLDRESGRGECRVLCCGRAGRDLATGDGG
jgi:hypothetical protein